MEAGFKPQGSFGIPENIRKQMEESSKARSAPKPEVKPPLESAPPPAEEKAAPSPSQKDQEDIRKLKKFWEEQLEIKITTKDMQDYLFKGRLIKDGVLVASYPEDEEGTKYADFRVTFQTHTPADLAERDELMAASMEIR